jgi:hypothetical protein
MESMLAQSSPLLHNTTAPASFSPINSETSEITAESSTSATDKSKTLQSDQLTLSDEAKAKSEEADKQETEDKKYIDARSLSNVEAEETTEKSSETDLDEKIRELSMKILELTVEIQMLQEKVDKESVEERRRLEVDLAITKGQLDEAIKLKLKQGVAT